MKPKTERVKALIESKKTPFGEADRQYLETLSDERLNELETFANTLAAETDKSTEQKPTTQPPVEQPKEEAPQEATPVTAEAYIAAAPAPVREFLQAGIRAANTAKESAIAQLRASGRCDFSEDELRVKSYDELQRLAKLAGTGQPVPQAPVDFSGQPLPRAAAGGNDKIPDPPPSLTDKIRSLRTRVQ